MEPADCRGLWFHFFIGNIELLQLENNKRRKPYGNTITRTY